MRIQDLEDRVDRLGNPGRQNERRRERMRDNGGTKEMHAYDKKLTPVFLYKASVEAQSFSLYIAPYQHIIKKHII